MGESRREFEELLKRLAAPVGLARLVPGVVIQDRYRVLKMLAEGGMGEVYAAEHIPSGKHVALKCLKPALGDNRECVARFEAEAQAASRIGHPNIVEVLDTGELFDRRPYLCMELLEGHTMQDELRRGPFAPKRLVRIARQVCDALGAAHRHGIVHRDLKPSNVFLIAHVGDPDYVKLGDFGISKLVAAGTRLTTSGVALGTPHFMAPEQATGERGVNHRVDVYAVGVLLYYCATGCLPFDAETFPELVVRICTTAPTPAQDLCAGINEALAAVIEISMAKLPDERFQSMGALSAALMRT